MLLVLVHRAVTSRNFFRLRLNLPQNREHSLDQHRAAHHFTPLWLVRALCTRTPCATSLTRRRRSKKIVQGGDARVGKLRHPFALRPCTSWPGALPRHCTPHPFTALGLPPFAIRPCTSWSGAGMIPSLGCAPRPAPACRQLVQLRCGCSRVLVGYSQGIRRVVLGQY